MYSVFLYTLLHVYVYCIYYAALLCAIIITELYWEKSARKYINKKQTRIHVAFLYPKKGIKNQLWFLTLMCNNILIHLVLSTMYYSTCFIGLKSKFTDGKM